MNQADAYFRSSNVVQLPPGAGLNVFGEAISPDERTYEPAPCRSIPVTDELRRQDAAQQAQREARERAPAGAWAIKAELSVENLRTVKRRAKAPGREAEPPAQRRVVVARPAKTKRAPKAAAPVLRLVRDPAPEPVVATAAAALDVAKPKRRRCVRDGCGRRLNRQNEICNVCRRKERRVAERAAHEAARVVCATAGCEAKLRYGQQRRADGLCGECASKLRQPETYAVRVARRPSVPCAVCGEPARGKMGRCLRHLRTGLMTMLLGRSATDHGLNQLWAELSEADKTVILSEYADGAA